MKPTKIIFIRHGEVDNKNNVLYGRLPGFSLSKRGIGQIENTARKLKKYTPRHLYTSPLLRARQSSAIIGRTLELKPVISRRLIEVDIIFQGMPLSQYREKTQPGLYSEKNIKRGQESIERIFNRMLNFVETVKKRHPQKVILAVSHGDPILILKALSQNKPFTWEYKRNKYLKTGGYNFLTIYNNKFTWHEAADEQK